MNKHYTPSRLIANPLRGAAIHLSQARLLLERVLRSARPRHDAHELQALSDALNAAAFVLNKKAEFDRV